MECTRKTYHSHQLTIETNNAGVINQIATRVKHAFDKLQVLD